MKELPPILRSSALVVLVALALLVGACAGRGPVAGPSPSKRPSTPPPSVPTTALSASPSPARTTPSPARPRLSPKPSPTVPPSPAPAEPSGPPTSLLGTQWYALPTSQKVVALTFDAGANADAVPSILATLAAEGVSGTFFLTGAWVRAYPDLAARIGASHPVGNHSFSHPDLTTLSDAKVVAEVRDAEAAIDAATGRVARPLFRFPFGASSQHLIELLGGLGYGCVNWTVDTRGWMGTSGGQSADSVLQRVLDGLRPGAIVIMHVGSNPDDGSTLDADALPRVIGALRGRGYGFVTLSQFLGGGA